MAHLSLKSWPYTLSFEEAYIITEPTTNEVDSTFELNFGLRLFLYAINRGHSVRPGLRDLNVLRVFQVSVLE